GHRSHCHRCELGACRSAGAQAAEEQARSADSQSYQRHDHGGGGRGDRGALTPQVRRSPSCRLAKRFASGYDDRKSMGWEGESGIMASNVKSRASARIQAAAPKNGEKRLVDYLLARAPAEDVAAYDP